MSRVSVATRAGHSWREALSWLTSSAHPRNMDRELPVHDLDAIYVIFSEH